MSDTQTSKISNIEWGLVIGALLTVDLGQIVLEWLVIGLILNPFIDIFVGMSLALYLQLRGQSLASPKRLFGLIGTFVGELIPVVDELPLWCLDGIFNMVISKSDTIMSKIPGEKEVAKVAGINNSRAQYSNQSAQNHSNEKKPRRSFVESINTSTQQLNALNRAIKDRREPPQQPPRENISSLINPVRETFTPSHSPNNVVDLRNQNEQIASPIQPIESVDKSSVDFDSETEEKVSRYREKISNPESLKAIDQNSEQFHAQRSAFTSKIEDYKTKGSVQKEDFDKLLSDNQRLAGTLMYGTERGNKRFKHFENIDVINKEADDRGQEAYEEVMKPLTEEFYNNLAKTGTDIGIVKKLSEEKADKARSTAFNGVRDGYFGNQEASLYAIGVKDSDINSFLATQSKLQELAQQFGYKEDEWITKNDFEVSRYRAYFEARRTARNVFTHVTSRERMEQIIKSKVLKSSNLTTEEGADWRELKAKGQTSNIEDSLYFTSGGGGYSYGTKIEHGHAVSKKVEDFVFLATTGADLISSGKTVEVSRPSLSEQHESLRGRTITDFESIKGTELPLETLYIVAPESTAFDYMSMLTENGFSDEYAGEHIIMIPDDIVKEALGRDGMIQRDSPVIQNYVDTELKRILVKESKNKDKIFATIAGKESRDAVSSSQGNTVFKWQPIN